MTQKDYSHRSTIDKLGIKHGQAVEIAAYGGEFEEWLQHDVMERVGRSEACTVPLDVVLLSVDRSDDFAQILRSWKPRIKSNGAIWLLTPKRGHPGYVNQTDLIPTGAAAGMVDNKTCSVSDKVSGMRFVIRRADRTG